MKEYTLQCPSGAARIALVASRFNHFVTDQLVAGAHDALTRHGVNEEDIVLAWVPGAVDVRCGLYR